MIEAEGIRIQKVLAQAGIASRRASEELIMEGRVEVNGKLAVLGQRVDPERDRIRVDGSRIPAPRKHTYLVLNKPRGVVSTMEDPEGRRTLADFVPPRSGRLFHVGRLDTQTEGLIILTNDGEFANRLAHPRYEVKKTYLVEAAGVVEPKTLQRLEKGVKLDDGPVRPDRVKLVAQTETRSMLRVTLHEGRNRVVRRMMEAVGHPVDRLSRIAIGPIRLGQLAPGEVREVTSEELGKLLDIVGM
ncbi:pseudouridine synthase [Tessaracoccus sp. OH4464_COT-324]|uniref:pseudouridine synthase n=1 Tax=Tessaracoccus sp. OH4464_COT-324 TaxID=2491059 RepID=UPI000F62C618|nr:pseudouridine synthase [Tessaracoccus sp. OH4464_COT-324]RRD47526.1 rRNA pseudouridine synthase [Tessaracoccus sp. OH4464_COT-324]